MLALLLALASEEPRWLVPDATFKVIADEYSGELAYENVRRIVDQHRIQGSVMMGRSAEVVLAELKAAGLEAEIDTYRSDGAVRYGTMTSPMGWEIRRGELWVTSAPGEGFEPFRMSRYADVPMSVSTYSKGGEWSGELVDVGRGTEDEDYAGKDVKGKVALASGYAGNVHRKAVLARGAVGVVIYPEASDRPDHPDMIRYNGLWTQASEVSKASGGFQISRNQYDKLAGLMKKGPVRVKGAIDATLGAGKLTLVHARIRGTSPDKEVLLIGHLDHPKWSANDNASGSGALVEVARTLVAAITRGALPKPIHTIHFVWVPEFFGTLAWVQTHPEVRACGEWDDPRPKRPKGPCAVAALNLDMVGEDTAKCDSRFYFTRTPDSVPSFLDAVLADVLAETKAANLVAPTGTTHIWPTEIASYSQGSDHDVLLGLGVPTAMIGHWPDWTHHTSEDRLDKVDPSELRRSGVFAAAAGYWLASATPSDWARLEPIRRADDAVKLAGRVIGSPAARQRRLFERTTPPSSSGRGPRRLVLLPYDDALADLTGAEKTFAEAAGERFEAVGADFNTAVYEAVNFMDGKTSPGQLAERLSDEFGVDVDQVWMEKLIDLLVARKLVER